MPLRKRRCPPKKDDQDYEVEKIVAYNTEKDTFCVRWVGYDESHDEWKSRGELEETCVDLLRAFERGGRSPSPEKEHEDEKNEEEEEEGCTKTRRNTKKFIKQCLTRDKNTAQKTPITEVSADDAPSSSTFRPPTFLPLNKKDYAPRGIVCKEEESFLFSKLPQSEQNCYPEKTKYASCVLSTCIQTPCIGKVKINNMYHLQRAKWIHLSHIKKPWYRTIPFTRLYGRFREEHALCTGCFHAFDTHKEGVTDYLNILQLCNTCFICKGSHSYIRNNTSQVLGLCNFCKSITHDARWKRCIALLSKLYPQENIILKSEVKIVSGMTLDYLITFEKDEYYACILIEKDDAQHANRDNAQEKSKIIEQTVGIIVQRVTQQKIPLGRIKCWFIRFGDHGMYNRSTHPQENVMENISYDMRIVILRQWIIWYIEHFEEMRQTMFTYFWYNNALAKRRYPLSTKYEGATLFYDAPRSSAHCPWRYAASPDEVREDTESKNDEKQKLIANSVDMNLHEYTWHKKHENLPYPPEIRTRLQTILPNIFD